MHSTSIFERLIFAVVLLSVPALFAHAAVPRLLFGLRTDGADRVIQSVTLGQSVPAASARAVAAAFDRAPLDDGDDRARGAEFRALSSPGDSATLSQSREALLEALTHAPANSRAWTLLCEIEAKRAPPSAVACLDT